MNRRLSLAFAVIPLIGLAVQGAPFLRDWNDNLERRQHADRQRRRSLVFTALEEAKRAVVDAVHKDGTTVGAPSFDEGCASISEGPVPRNRF